MALRDFLYREKRLLRNNCVKYHVITCVLDYLVICKHSDGERFVPTANVKDWLDSQGTFDYAWKVPYAQIQLWMQEMEFLNLIEFGRNREKIALTEHGYEAYKSQQYHFAYASLLEAKNSRTLSKIAIFISIIAILIAAVGLFVGTL